MSVNVFARNFCLPLSVPFSQLTYCQPITPGPGSHPIDQKTTQPPHPKLLQRNSSSGQNISSGWKAGDKEEESKTNNLKFKNSNSLNLEL